MKKIKRIAIPWHQDWHSVGTPHNAVSLFYPAQFLIGICSKKILRIFYKGLANWRRQSYHTDTSGVWLAFGFDQSSENNLCCCTIRFKRMASLLSA